MKPALILGVAGASGSGKTLVAKNLRESIGPEDVCILEEDAYYRDLSDLPGPIRDKMNFDHPQAFDHQMLIAQLRMLLDGNAVDIPIYNYATHSRRDETRHFDPCRVIILEGILILNDPQLRDLFDIKVFVDTPLDICLLRRLKRDLLERGRSVTSIMEQYENTVRPMFKAYVEPSKQYADVIIPHGGENRVAIDVFKARLLETINQKIKSVNE
jgi:uridine kinase